MYCLYIWQGQGKNLHEGGVCLVRLGEQQINLGQMSDFLKKYVGYVCFKGTRHTKRCYSTKVGVRNRSFHSHRNISYN